MRRRILFLTFAALFLLPLARGQISLGVSPAEVVFPELYIDGYASRGVLISTANPEEINISLSIEGEQEWLYATPESVVISLGEPARVTLIAQPEQADPMTHEANLVITARGSEGGPGQGDASRSTVQAVLAVPISVPISGESRPDCRAAVGVVPVGSSRSMLLDVEVKNTGNVRLALPVDVDVVSLGDAILVSHTFTSEVVRSGESVRFQEGFEHGLEPGIYWALVSVFECNYFTSIPITVLDVPDEVARLAGLSSPADAEPGEIIPLTATLYNPHDHAIDASYVVRVEEGKRQTETISSETIRLAPGETQNLTVYFRPKAAATYTLLASVVERSNGGGSTRIEHELRVVGASSLVWRKVRFFGELVIVAGLILVMMRLIGWERKRRKE